VAFSPDGARLASGSFDGTVRVWDVHSATQLFHHRAGGEVHTVAFSPDGTRLASVSNGATGFLSIWDVFKGATLFTFQSHLHSTYGMTFSPDGRYLAAAGDRAVHIWDAGTGTFLASIDGHEHKVSSVAFAPDSMRIASGSWDFTVRVWDGHGDQVLCLRGHEGPVTSVAFSPDGTRLVSGSLDQTVRVWDAGTGASMLCLHGHGSPIHSVAISPNGLYLASASGDQTVRLWDTRIGSQIRRLQGHQNTLTAVAFASAAPLLVTGSFDGTVRVWDAWSGTQLLCLPGQVSPVRSVAISPDGSRIASATDWSVCLWDTHNGGRLHCFNFPGVTSLAFSPDGAALIGGSGDYAIHSWDVQSGELRLNEHWGDNLYLRSHKASLSLRILEEASASSYRRTWSNSLDTAISLRDSTTPVAWFPLPIFLLTTQASSLTWAGASEGNYLCLFTLEGNK
jgi:WD40 repeat protein